MCLLHFAHAAVGTHPHNPAWLPKHPLPSLAARQQQHPLHPRCQNASLWRSQNALLKAKQRRLSTAQPNYMMIPIPQPPVSMPYNRHGPVVYVAAPSRPSHLAKHSEDDAVSQHKQLIRQAQLTVQPRHQQQLRATTASGSSAASCLLPKLSSHELPEIATIGCARLTALAKLVCLG